MRESRAVRGLAYVAGSALLLAFGPAPGGDFEFAIVGDRTGGAQPGVYEQVWREIAAVRPEFAVTIGDTIEGGHDGTAESEWRRLRPIWLRFHAPVYFTPGNHDIWSPVSRRIYIEQSGRPAHYSFDHGGAHFTILDNSGSFNLAASEIEFLTTDLERNRGRSLKFVFFHQPFWLLPLKLQNSDFAFHQLMRQFHVQYVIGGHVHQFARMERDGVTYVMAGSAGGHLRGHDPIRDFNAGWFYQWLRVRVAGSRASITIQELGPPFGKGRKIPIEDWGESGYKQALLPNEAGELAVFPHAVDREHLVMHDHIHARREQARGEQAFGQILESVAALKAERRHGSREHDRNR